MTIKKPPFGSGGVVSRNKDGTPRLLWCNVCEKAMGPAKFSKASKSKSGYLNMCKACSNKRVKSWIADNREHYNAYQLKKQRSYTRRNVDIIRKALNNSICYSCGSDKPLRFASDKANSPYFDPVMSLAKRARPVHVIEAAIAKAKPVCLACV